MSLAGSIARRVVVRGRVQGVFFRDCTRREAQRHDVAGWVRNRPDGAVEAHFEGAEPAIRVLVDWCRCGPANAGVDAVEITETAPEDLDGFEVR